MSVEANAALPVERPTDVALPPVERPTITPMPVIDPAEYFSSAVRAQLRRERDERRTRFRSSWWFPLLVVLIGMSGSWALLKADQVIAEDLIWPAAGVQFVEVGPAPDDPAATGRPLLVVVGGLNRKSGTGPALALMPALSAGGTRVFSLVYGSGISDQDILDKFDALMSADQPRTVSFFGSSMGGDVVLNLAAHAQGRRDAYREQLLDAAVPFGPGLTGNPAAQNGSANSALVAGGFAPGAPAGDLDPSADGVATSGAAAGQQLGVGTIVVDLKQFSLTATAAADPPVELADDEQEAVEPPPAPPPVIGTIYLDCSPLDADDVRHAGRTSADALTRLTEALHTDGGVAARMTAEVLAQQDQWSTGRFPFVDIRRADLLYKIDQVWRDKIGNTGISTQLVKDQYGVIRRMHVDDVLAALSPGTRIVYFLPENRDDDRTIRVRHVEQRLRALAAANRLDLTVVAIAGGHHASAESNSESYLSAMAALTGRPD